MVAVFIGFLFDLLARIPDQGLLINQRFFDWIIDKPII